MSSEMNLFVCRISPEFVIFMIQKLKQEGSALYSKELFCLRIWFRRYRRSRRITIVLKTKINSSSSKKPHTLPSVLSSPWALGDRVILAPRGSKFNTTVVKHLFVGIARVLSCVCVCAATEGPGKSRTRTGTLGDTWDRRQPGEADHYHSSQGSSSAAQGHWRNCWPEDVVKSHEEQSKGEKDFIPRLHKAQTLQLVRRKRDFPHGTSNNKDFTSAAHQETTLL